MKDLVGMILFFPLFLVTMLYGGILYVVESFGVEV